MHTNKKYRHANKCTHVHSRMRISGASLTDLLIECPFLFKKDKFLKQDIRQIRRRQVSSKGERKGNMPLVVLYFFFSPLATLLFSFEGRGFIMLHNIKIEEIPLVRTSQHLDILPQLRYQIQDHLSMIVD